MPLNLRKIYYNLSPELRLFARRLFYLPTDFINKATGRRHKYEPPKGKIFIGSGDFIKQGKHHLDMLKLHADIKSDDSVLDIGCGIGRSAVALTEFLSPKGSYDGFDVMKEGINWCKNTITKDFPNFHFKLTELKNDLYNSKKESAENFKFPYPNKAFDVAFLFSVFTHMQPNEIQNYLNEINRTLKDDGRCLATFFIYDDSNESQISNVNRDFNFKYSYDGYRLMDDKVKSANIAFHEKKLNEMLTIANLKVSKRVNGFWIDNSTKSTKNDFQDILILSKNTDVFKTSV